MKLSQNALTRSQDEKLDEAKGGLWQSRTGYDWFSKGNVRIGSDLALS
jgi:hypothetical protein